MKFGLYSVYDTKTQTYSPPFVAHNNPSAIRAFGDLAKDKNANINAHPEDYLLFHVADWDDDTGKFSQVDAKQLASAEDFTNVTQGTETP